MVGVHLVNYWRLGGDCVDMDAWNVSVDVCVMFATPLGLPLFRLFVA